MSTILTDSHRVLTVSSYLDAEIEMVEDVSLGVPAVITKKGVAMIVPIHMNDYEYRKFREAARIVKQTTDEVLQNIKKIAQNLKKKCEILIFIENFCKFVE